MLITSGTETSGYSHALAYIASLRLATPAHGHDRMLITSGTETSGYSHALAYIASLRLATPAHMAFALIRQMQKSPAV